MHIVHRAHSLPIILTAIMSSVLGLPQALAEDGISPTEIAIGQCAALEGPASGLGQGMNKGLAACLNATNAKGGVNGRKLKLVAVDDGYDPDKCVDGTLKLIEEDKVFCLAGYVGTPTGKAALPLITDKKIPLVGLFTGAMIFRQPVNRWVFNVRASYDNETDLLVERLTKDLGVSKIAVFYQNDSFGLAGFSGTEKALGKRQLQVAAKGTFERNTLAIKAGLAQIMAGQPEAVIMVGPYKPIAAFVKEARAAGLSVPLATISFVGTENLIKELGDAATGLTISQVVPSPDDTSIPVVKEYQEALKTSFPDAKPTYVSLEGYVTGKVLIAGLEKTGATPTRDGLVDALESFQAVELGGITASFAKDNHQALSSVRLTCVSEGKAKPVTALTK